MFLCDCAEFGRKVKITKPSPEFVTTHGEKNYLRKNNGTTPLNQYGIRGDSLITKEGDNPFQYVSEIKTPNIKNKNQRVNRNILYESIKYNGKTITNRNMSYVRRGNHFNRRQEVRDPNKKPIKLSKEESKKLLNKQQTIPNSSKSSRKFLNKYTLGGLGVLGGVAATYGGYKLLTRNKNKKEK